MIEGHKFKAETMPEIPFSTWDVENKKIGAVIGELWHQIFEKTLNFTTDISQPPDMKWGSPNDDGTWNGLVGGLLENRSQIILAALYRTVARSYVIDFSSTFGEARTRIFIKYPEREDNWTPFMEPFHPFVWFCLFLVLLTLITSLVASYTFGTEKSINHGSFTLSNTPIIVWGSFLSQGSYLDPKSCASKTIFLISLLVGVLAVASFNATLTSYLTVNKVRLPFTTLAGVIGSGYKVGGVGAIFDDFLHAPVGSIKRAIGDEIIRKHPDAKIENYEEGHIKMLNEKFGYITDFNHMRKKNKDNCLFIDIPQDVSTFQVGLGFTKHFEYTELFNQAIQKNSENGGIDRVMRRWIAKPQSDCNGNTPVGMENVISAFVLIFGGFSLSLAAFCIELGRSKVGSTKIMIKDMWR